MCPFEFSATPTASDGQILSGSLKNSSSTRKRSCGAAAIVMRASRDDDCPRSGSEKEPTNASAAATTCFIVQLLWRGCRQPRRRVRAQSTSAERKGRRETQRPQRRALAARELVDERSHGDPVGVGVGRRDVVVTAAGDANERLWLRYLVVQRAAERVRDHVVVVAVEDEDWTLR